MRAWIQIVYVWNVLGMNDDETTGCALMTEGYYFIFICWLVADVTAVFNAYVNNVNSSVGG